MGSEYEGYNEHSWGRMQAAQAADPAYSPNTMGGTGTASNDTPEGASQSQPRSKVGNLVKTAIKAYAGGAVMGGGAAAPAAEGAGAGAAAETGASAGDWMHSPEPVTSEAKPATASGAIT